MRKVIKKLLSPILKSYDTRLAIQKSEIDALYRLLYDQVHNYDQTLPFSGSQTVDAFGFQWSELKEGEVMLSDDWFREHVSDIICENEIQLKREWFKGKDVIDCGCGGGRWSYGMAKMGANITAVDINSSALQATKEALEDIPVRKEFIHTPLEQLSEQLPADKKYDLVWSWGVLHHCGSFTNAFQQVMNRVKDGGFIYLYLYGRESIPYDVDINLFKQRVLYNTLQTYEEKERFLLAKSNGNRVKLHQNHDLYSPLLNRRLEFDYVKKVLEENGFTDVTRTMISTGEVNVRAVKKAMKPEDAAMLLPAPKKADWLSAYR